MRDIFTIFRRYARIPWFGLVLMFISQLAATGSPLVFGQLVTMLTDDSASMARLWWMVAVVCVLDLLHAACHYGFVCALIRATAATARRLKNEAARHFLHLGAEERENSSGGEWERRICSDTQIVAQSIIQATGEIACTLASFFLAGFVMAQQHPIFLILVAVLALCFFGIYRFNKWKLWRSAMNARTSNYKEGATLLDFIGLAPIISIFRVAKNLFGRFSQVTWQMEQRSAEAEQSAEAYTFQIRIVVTLGISACLVISVTLFLMGRIEVGTIVSYMMLVGTISAQMGQLVFAVPILARGAESAQSLEKALGLASGRRVDESSHECYFSAAEVNSYMLCLENVSFAYHNGRCILDHLDWFVQPGEYHSILGSNGAGKSTLIRVILGSLSGCTGNIKRNFSRPGYVPQTTTIFHGSLRENLTLCNKAITDDKLREVIRRCRLEKLAAHLGGLDAPISHEHLSGGEVQRIGIARALAITPDLLVVDEITNNLDIVNKAIIFEMLRGLRGSCTVISISHDMEALSDSDFCWLLYGGQLHNIPKGSAEQKRAFAFNLLESHDLKDSTL